jgi:hypothetical protein
VANAAPSIGPVTINEIMYHPPDFSGGADNTRDEFIELCQRRNESGGEAAV